VSAAKSKTAPAGDAETETPDETVAGDDNPDEIVTVYGATAERCTTLRSVSLSLVVGTGERNDGQLVLVPYVECELMEDDSDSDSEPPKPLTWILTLDNVAFLVEEFSTDLAGLVSPLANMAKGELKPARERLEYAVQCIARANEQLAAAGDGLRELLAES